MEENQIVEPVKKKSPIGTILLCIIFIALGLGVGFYVGKTMSKGKETTKEETKQEEKQEEKKEYVKPEADSKYKLLKEDLQEVVLNNESYHLLAYYYETEDKSLYKELYFENKRIESDIIAFSNSFDNTKEEFIEENIKEFNKTKLIFNDSKSDDQYLVFYKKHAILWGPESDPWPSEWEEAVIVDKNGTILFNVGSSVEFSSVYLAFKNKDDVLDRDYYEDEFETLDGVTEKRYFVYGGKDKDNPINKTVEFKEDHFYALINNEECSYIDSKYEIVNGELKEKVLKTYLSSDDQVVEVGASC